jgi:magnesium-transporting ATPase (P-type)
MELVENPMQYNSEVTKNHSSLSSKNPSLTIEMLEVMEELKEYQKGEFKKSRGPGSFQKTTWEEVKVGDIIQVRKDEYFPADILLLGSSDSKERAFVETKNLDGETTLKVKQIPEMLKDHKRLLNSRKIGNILPDRRKSKLARTTNISFNNVCNQTC